MAILKAVNVRVGRNANLKGIINYVLQPKKTEEQLTYGYCVDVPEALEKMNETKQVFGKLKGRQYYHFVQSFPPNEKISAKQAHEVAVKFAEECRKFRGFEMIAVTHKDRDHLHTHFILNSVSFIDGHKFHITRKELAEMKELQNQICIRLGFSAAPEKGIGITGKKREKITAHKSGLFRILKKAETKDKDSYIQNCSEAILQALKLSKNKDLFIQLMHAQGFETEWKDNKKHVTFTDIKRKNAGEKKCKIRLNKLAQYYPSLKDIKTKEDLLDGIRRNLQSEQAKPEFYRAESESSVKSVSTGSVAAAGDTDKSNFGKTSGVVDFNSRFEQYSSNVDRGRAIRSAEENARRTRELAEAEQRRIAEQQRAAQPAVERNEKRVQYQNEELSDGDSKSTEQTQERESDGYSR